MGALHTPGQLGRRPLPRYTGGPRGPGLYHAVAAVALEHDLPPVLDLPHVGPVLVQPHVADQQDLPVLDEAREGTVDLFTPGSQTGPVTEVALGGVVPLQHVAVPALELAHHAVVHVGRHHHPVPRGVRELRALGGDTLGDTVPGPVVADRAAIVAGLELRDAGHSQGLVVTCTEQNNSIPSHQFINPQIKIKFDHLLKKEGKKSPENPYFPTLRNNI